MKKIIILLIFFYFGTALCETFPSGKTVLITGSNRGIGLGLATEFAEQGWNVIATARNPDSADELQALAAKYKTVAVEKLDVTSDADINALSNKYREQPIDILYNNAAFIPPYSVSRRPFDELDIDNTRLSFDVNVIGPMHLARVFLPNVEASHEKKIINTSSGAASFGRGPAFGTSFNYITSKTALNMFTWNLAAALKDRGITVVCLHPGVVQTNRPGNEEENVPASLRNIPYITVDESSSRLVELVTGLTLDDTGKFLNYADGSEIPW